MITLNGLAQFGGNEGEDASTWFKSFIAATIAYDVGAVLRIFPTYLKPNSPAHEWYYGLPDNAVVSWSAVERKFQQRWVFRTAAQGNMGSGTSTEILRNHRLTDDAIFAPSSTDHALFAIKPPDVATMNKVIVEWADDHFQLGAATGLDDVNLMQITTSNLPAFLRAFLKYHPSPPVTTFQGLCTRIKEIEDHILEFEQLRRQEVDLESLRELVTTVKKLHDDINKPSMKGTDSGEGDAATAAVTTGSEDDETAIFFLPEEWKNTKVSVGRARMVEMVKEVIGTLRKYQPSDITIDAGNMMDIGLLHYYSAIKMPHQFHSSTIIGQTGSPNNVLLGILRINYQQYIDGIVDVTECTKTWESLHDSEPNHIIKKQCIYNSNHNHVHYLDGDSLALSSANAQYRGGLAKLGYNKTFPWLGISSFDTILYFLLSVYLAERVTSGGKKYKQAAIDSANWVIKWAYDEDRRLVKDFTWDMFHRMVWGTTTLSPHLTGLFVEGLSVLASVTGEQKWMTLTGNICNSAMMHRDWHDDEGVFKYVSPSGALEVDDANMFRGLLIRGLSVAYERNQADKELRHKIRSYTNVQFNGIREFAHYRGSYGAIWSGPYTGPSVYAEMAALNLFMATVIVNHY